MYLIYAKDIYNYTTINFFAVDREEEAIRYTDILNELIKDIKYYDVSCLYNSYDMNENKLSYAEYIRWMIGDTGIIRYSKVPYHVVHGNVDVKDLFDPRK